MFENTQQGTVNVISGSDPITSKTSEDLAALFQECLSSGHPRFVLDLEHVPLLDSQGLTLLLDTSDVCDRRGGTLQLAAPNYLCEDILRATGVGSHFEIFEDVTSAVRSFAR